MRIGEISMNINTRACNYGSILHSWAFQYYLKQYEKIEVVETIDYVRKDLEKWNRSFPELEWIKRGKPKRLIKQIFGHRAYTSRRTKVDRFIENNMSISKRRYLQKDLVIGKLDYDVLVSDSDTIWAPRANGEFDDGYFLNLPAMDGIKKISYAPSMGNAEISSIQQEKLRKLLSEYAHISCRESYERDVIEKCTTKTVTKVIDPVLLLSREDWIALLDKNPIKRNFQDYVLVYQPVDKSSILEECAQKYAQEHRKKIITISISDKILKKPSDSIVINDCAPEEFVYLILNAAAVFTNSFHMICFSIIFEKEFYAFSRKDDKKVIDICETVGLADRYIRNRDDYKASSIDYLTIKKLLLPQIEKSKEWLHNALYN